LHGMISFCRAKQPETPASFGVSNSTMATKRTKKTTQKRSSVKVKDLRARKDVKGGRINKLAATDRFK
jgi:hypothetical protein